MSVQPVQQVFIFGLFTGTKGSGTAVDPLRPIPVNVALPLGVQTRDACELEISVTEQVDFPLTVQLLRKSDQAIVYQLGGQAADDIVLKPCPNFIVDNSSQSLRQLQILSTGRCTVVIGIVPCRSF